MTQAPEEGASSSTSSPDHVRSWRVEPLLHPRALLPDARDRIGRRLDEPRPSVVGIGDALREAERLEVLDLAAHDALVDLEHVGDGAGVHATAVHERREDLVADRLEVGVHGGGGLLPDEPHPDEEQPELLLDRGDLVVGGRADDGLGGGGHAAILFGARAAVAAREDAKPSSGGGRVFARPARRASGVADAPEQIREAAQLGLGAADEHVAQPLLVAIAHALHELERLGRGAPARARGRRARRYGSRRGRGPRACGSDGSRRTCPSRTSRPGRARSWCRAA